ncbi:MAG: DUF2007 domain-containing protein [Coraliomargarita sp.]
MHEVFRDIDSAKVGMLDGVLKESGIPTLIKNWTGSNITEIPIPSLYPTIYVLDAKHIKEAKQLIADYLNPHVSDQQEWTCPACNSTVDGFLTECWSCQTEQPVTN